MVGRVVRQRGGAVREGRGRRLACCAAPPPPQTRRTDRPASTLGSRIQLVNASLTPPPHTQQQHTHTRPKTTTTTTTPQKKRTGAVEHKADLLVGVDVLLVEAPDLVLVPGQLVPGDRDHFDVAVAAHLADGGEARVRGVRVGVEPPAQHAERAQRGERARLVGRQPFGFFLSSVRCFSFSGCVLCAC